jgi:hypothetical protein
MSTDLFRRYGNLLRSDGTNQLQRLLPALEADYIVPDERAFSDLVKYARNVAAEVRYYDLSGQSTGDWRPLVESLLDPATGQVVPAAQLEALLDGRANWPPHLVLFLAFLKVFQNLQGDLNQLTVRHLRYYYGTALGIQPLAATPDDVHVLFTLARNAAPTLLPAGTLLDAGKDEKGRALVYATQNDVVVTAATVSGIARLVMELDRLKNRRFFMAQGFSDLEGPGKYTFGSGQLDLDVTQRYMTEAPLGFAVAAPILSLAEGSRTIRILAHLAPPSTPVVAQDIGYALDVTLTGAKGWLAADSLQANLIDKDAFGNPALSLTVSLGEAATAVVAFDPKLHGPGPAAGPLLRCLIKGATGIYETLDGLVVKQVEMSVAVQGVRTLVVQNTDGPLNSSQAMPLFGSQPQLGSTFYIGSSEVFAKRLTSLGVRLEWKSPPPDLFVHYRQYFDYVDAALSDNFYAFFQANLDLLYGRQFRLLSANQRLFSPVTTDPQTIQAVSSDFDSAFAGTPYEEQPDLGPLQSFDTGSKFGFVRLVLNEPNRVDMAQYASTIPFEAFGHSAFPRRYTQSAIALAQWTPASPNAKPALPSDPYTPVLKSLSLDYSATAVLVPGDIHSAATFLIVGPFGVTRAGTQAAARVVPEIDGQAALYLGIGQVTPPANLPLLFQIDAGTATSTQVLKPGDAQWSYLAAGDSWQTLNSSAVLDSTEGFQKAGLIAIAVPSDAALDHDSLTSGLIWLRAVIQLPPESASRTVDVKPNAALAQFQPATGLTIDDYVQHLLTPLPAGTITKLVKRNANIQAVQQPSPSFAGRGLEGDTGYFQRISERLRHRNRAVTAWDLERLVLEAFPEVFKVKCLPHTDATGSFKAGEAALVIVPNVQRTGAVNVLEPRASAVLMEEIEQCVAGLTSAFATVHAIQPVFERLRVEANVVFQTGRDPGYYSGVLDADLRRFLSPWAYQDGVDILFGARIYRSEILAFVEGRDYVDHLTDFNLYHSFDGPPRDGIGSMTIGVDFFIRAKPQPAISQMAVNDDFVVGRGVEVAETTQPQAILVSHPQHLIRAVAAGSEVCPGAITLGIGYMTVGLDLIVQPVAAS